MSISEPLKNQSESWKFVSEKGMNPVNAILLEASHKFCFVTGSFELYCTTVGTKP